MAPYCCLAKSNLPVTLLAVLVKIAFACNVPAVGSNICKNSGDFTRTPYSFGMLDCSLLDDRIDISKDTRLMRLKMLQAKALVFLQPV
jgi:hypothetical protein